MSIKGGYDRIAFVYDFIAKIFSFNQINRSQLGFLSHLSAQQTCLIIGGGTGYFLQKLLEQNKTIRVTYVDASEKMIAFAQERIRKNNPSALKRVTFICKRVEDFEFEMYDVIVCNYFLDLFENSYVDKLVATFKRQLNSSGLLYVTDFDVPEQKGALRWCTESGLKILYVIHRQVTQIHAYRLPAIQQSMMEHGFVVMHSKKYLKGILKCCLYKMDVGDI